MAAVGGRCFSRGLDLLRGWGERGWGERERCVCFGFDFDFTGERDWCGLAWPGAGGFRGRLRYWRRSLLEGEQERKSSSSVWGIWFGLRSFLVSLFTPQMRMIYLRGTRNMTTVMTDRRMMASQHRNGTFQPSRLEERGGGFNMNHI